MRRQIQTLSIAFAIAAAATATGAVAQTTGMSNLLSRGTTQQNSFYYSAIKSGSTISSPLATSSASPSMTNLLSRPTASMGAVTPVPEPSEWAMLLAGLALVGFIVRRNAKRP